MKSYKEMADNVFSRIVEEKEMEIKKRHNRVYMASTMAVFGLAILIGVGIWLNGQITVGEPGPEQSDGSENGETEDTVIHQQLLERIEQAVWENPLLYGPDIGPIYKTYTNGFRCEERLYNVLIDSPDKIYAIGISPRIIDEELDAYVGEDGKTYEEIEQRYEDLWDEYVELQEVERRGKVIEKYLFKGEVDLSASWVINENTIKSVIKQIGEGLINTYFVDGKYRYNELMEDILSNRAEQDKCKLEMKTIASTYRQECAENIKAQMDAQNIPVLVYQTKNNGHSYFGCCIFVTAEEFNKITLENAENYTCYLSMKPEGLENGEVIVEDDTWEEIVFSNYYYLPVTDAVVQTTNRILYSYENAEEGVLYAFCVTAAYNPKYEGLTKENEQKVLYRILCSTAHRFGIKILTEYPCEGLNCLGVIAGTMEQIESVFGDCPTLEGELWSVYAAPRCDLLDLMLQLGWDGESDISVGSAFYKEHEVEIKALLGDDTEVTQTVKVAEQE
ncbi:MAG: hypothetical protein E7283_01995 [Lachnospiraceae bacterium]|nr:hypothetical protein [Lachnospiraceae bacterium]